MRLTISDDNVFNASISRGANELVDANQPLYRVSTNASCPFIQTTTITDLNCRDPNTKLLATITWNSTKGDTIRFKDHEVDANDMLSQRWFSTSVFFLWGEA